MSPKKKVRSWLAWTIGSLWLATALAVLIATRIHPSTMANVALNVRKVSFRTDAQGILGPRDEDQLLISRIASLQVRGNRIQVSGATGSPSIANSLEILGEPSASCSFYRVRSSHLQLRGPTIVTLGWMGASGGRSFSLTVHGSMNGTLTSQAGEALLKPGFTCTRARISDGPAGNVNVGFSPEGGDSIFFATSSDARLDFDLADQPQIDETNMQILSELRFSDIDPRTSEEKTVLLKPPGGFKNQVTFEKLGRNVPIDDADLLVLHPKNELYLREFKVNEGIQLTLHGIVRDIRVGAGAKDLRTRMPTLLDYLDDEKRVYSLIPAIVALILGVLEKMGVLPRR